jgi:hypothetical protein
MSDAKCIRACPRWITHSIQSSKMRASHRVMSLKRLAKGHDPELDLELPAIASTVWWIALSLVELRPRH